MAKDTLTITDNRTGKAYEVDILHGTYPLYGSSIRTADLHIQSAGQQLLALLRR